MGVPPGLANETEPQINLRLGRGGDVFCCSSSSLFAELLQTCSILSWFFRLLISFTTAVGSASVETKLN